jgi:hypothetical protein
LDNKGADHKTSSFDDAKKALAKMTKQTGGIPLVYILRPFKICHSYVEALEKYKGKV